MASPAVIQPGGSVRDAEVIAAADEHGLAMVFTRVAALQTLGPRVLLFASTYLILSALTSEKRLI